MRKIIFTTLAILILLMPISVWAECDDAKLNELAYKAANVNLNWEPASKVIAMGSADEQPITAYYIKVYLYNLSEDLRAVVTNNINKKKMEFQGKDSVDNLITFDSDDVRNLYTYTVEIYPTDTTCDASALFKTSISLPKFNEQRLYYGKCDETPEFELCQEYITQDISYEDLVARQTEYAERKLEEASKNEEDESKGLFDLIKEYKYWVIGTVAIVGAVGVSAYVIIKKKRKSE